MEEQRKRRKRYSYDVGMAGRKSRNGGKGGRDIEEARESTGKAGEIRAIAGESWGKLGKSRASSGKTGQVRANAAETWGKLAKACGIACQYGEDLTTEHSRTWNQSIKIGYHCTIASVSF